MMNKIILITSFLSTFICFGQSVSNGSFTGLQPGTNTFNVTDWAKCPGTSPDVCDISSPTFMWNPALVSASESPDGGTWLGLAAQGECVDGNILGLTIGATYTLCFYGANFGSGHPSGLWEGNNAQPVITIGGSSQTFSIPKLAFTWNIYSMTFTATATTMVLNVSTPDITAGDYADPDAYYVCLDGFSISTTGSCAIVSPTTICDGDSIIVSASGYTADPGYEQLYVLVNVTSGNIVATNSNGTFTQADYGAGNIGDYEVYAVNSNDAAVITEMNGNGSWTTAQTNASSLCADIIGPLVYIIESCCDLDVTTIISDETCDEANDGSIDFSVTGSGTYDIIVDASVVFNDVTTGTYNWVDQEDGIYSIQIEDINDATCDTSFNITIVQGPAPTTPLFDPVSDICFGESLSPLPTVSSNGIQGSWSPTLDNETTTTYTFTPDSGQCATTTTMTITVNPLPIAGEDSLGVFCSNDPTSNLFDYLGGSAENGGSWSGPSTLTGGDIGTFNPQTMDAGDYVYTVSNACGVAEATVTVTFDPCIAPIANFTLSDSILCLGDCITITDASYEASSWQWTFDGGTPSSASSQGPHTICFDNEGTFVLKLVVSNSNGSDSITSLVTVHPLPLIDAGADVVIELGESVQLNATGSSNWLYTWSPPTGLDCINCTSPIANPQQTTIYTVAAVDTNGCSADDDVTVMVDFDYLVWVPNVFSPNGDGNNDIAYVKGEGVKSFKFFIFNRWGGKVFETTDLSFGWDGTSEGEEMNNGVYFYYLEVIFLDGSEEVKNGDITLIR